MISSEVIDVIISLQLSARIYKDWWFWKTIETIMVAIKARINVVISHYIIDSKIITIVVVSIVVVSVVIILILSYHA